jgi:hypothetical protein
MPRFVFAFLLGLGGAALAHASSPSLSGITPRGGQRGTEMPLFFNGARLSDAKEILFYSTGFSVTKLEIVNENQVKATVQIAADCRIGEHAMRVRTGTGLSELRTFYVGVLPNIDEKEPNRTLSPVAILTVDSFGWRLSGPAQPWILHNSKKRKI